LRSRAEHDAFLKLVDDHGAVMFGMLRRLCGNAADAEDVFQETAFRVWRNISSLHDVRSPRAWMLSIAYRSFLDRVDRQRSRQELWDMADTRVDSPGEQAVKVEEAQRVSVAVEMLSEPLRQVVILHYTGGLTLREAAAALGCNEGTVKSRLNAAITKLRSILK
jgi:RNA polymerase sigma factor (sigma-70 family)